MTLKAMLAAMAITLATLSAADAASLTGPKATRRTTSTLVQARGRHCGFGSFGCGYRPCYRPCYRPNYCGYRPWCRPNYCGYRPWCRPYRCNPCW